MDNNIYFQSIKQYLMKQLHRKKKNIYTGRGIDK